MMIVRSARVLPVRDATDDGSGHLVVNCPDCHAEHVHGRHRTDSTTCVRKRWYRPGPCTCPLGSADGPVVSDCTVEGAPRQYHVREVAR